MLTGATMNMTLELYKDQKIVCKIDDDTALLGSYPVDDDMILHVSLHGIFPSYFSFYNFWLFFYFVRIYIFGNNVILE